MRGYGGYGGYGGYAPWGNAAISERASGKLDEAKQLFRNHIALVDVSTGPVSRSRVRCCHREGGWLGHSG